MKKHTIWVVATGLLVENYAAACFVSTCGNLYLPGTLLSCHIMDLEDHTFQYAPNLRRHLPFKNAWLRIFGQNKGKAYRYGTIAVSGFCSIYTFYSKGIAFSPSIYSHPTAPPNSHPANPIPKNREWCITPPVSILPIWLSNSSSGLRPLDCPSPSWLALFGLSQAET